MKSYLLFFFLLILFDCNAQKEMITLDGHTFEAFAGPNMAKISQNFYADKTEITNSFWKEFLHWIKVRYGEDSQKYINLLPDESVWDFQQKVIFPDKNYLWSAEFDDYPVVGITLAQAKEYSNWRTERVAEMILIEKGIINANPSTAKEAHFTIEKFTNGDYPIRNKVDFLFVYPKMTVPTPEEWEEVSGLNSKFTNGTDSLDLHNKLFQNKNNFLFNTNDKIQILKNVSNPILSSKNGSINIFGLYHVIGNVSEIVAKEGISKGGDWRNTLKDANLKTNTKSNIPNCWTGFRCISRLEVIEIKY